MANQRMIAIEQLIDWLKSVSDSQYILWKAVFIESIPDAQLWFIDEWGQERSTFGDYVWSHRIFEVWNRVLVYRSGQCSVYELACVGIPDPHHWRVPQSTASNNNGVPLTYMIAYALLLIFSVFLTMNVYLHIGMLLCLFIVILICSCLA